MNTQVAVETDPFEECVSLSNEVVFYVPSTSEVDNDNPYLQAEVLAWLEEELASAYGGATENAPASGKWVSDAKGLVSEAVTPVTVYVAELSTEVKRHIVSLAKRIKEVMGQEAVLFVVNGEGKLI